MGQMHRMCTDGAYVDVREYLVVAASIAPAPKPCHHGTVAPHVRGWHNSSGRGSCADTTIGKLIGKWLYHECGGGK